MKKERRNHKKAKKSEPLWWEQLEAWLLDNSWVQSKQDSIERANLLGGPMFWRRTRNEQCRKERKILGMHGKIYDVQID